MENNGMIKAEGQGGWQDRSDSIAKIAGALSKAQAKIDAVKKDASNPFFKSKYADLASVWGAIREHLTANELSVIQEPGTNDGRLTLTTTLMHSSGEYLRSSLTLPVTKQDPQGYGSAITYARRYALQAVLGLAAEDDDGNAASGLNGTNKMLRRMPASPPRPRIETQVAPKMIAQYDLSKVANDRKDEAINVLKRAGAVTDDEFLLYWDSPVIIASLSRCRIGDEIEDEETGEVLPMSVAATQTQEKINRLKGGTK